MTQIDTYLRYQDVFGSGSTLDQFETLLRSLDLGLMLRLFSPINTICARRGLPDRDAAQVALIRELFDERTARKTLECTSTNGRGITVFHRKQCLFILREAMRVCPDIPGMQPTEIRESLALLSLMANDHVSDTAPQGTSPLDQIVALMCDFIPVTEANELRFEMASISRIHKIVHDIAPARAQESAYFDIAELFGRASGLPLRTYEALSLAVMPRVLKSPVDVLMHSPDYGIHINFFEQTQLSTEQRDTFFGLLARTPEEFRARIKERSPSLSDFTVFKESPFLRNPDRLVPIIGPVYCTKLISMSVDVIEKLSPYLIDTRLPAILADRMMADPDLRAPFFMKPISSLSAKGSRPPHLLQALNAELSRVAAAFLKGDPQT